METSYNPKGPLVFFRGGYTSLTDQDLSACGLAGHYREVRSASITYMIRHYVGRRV